MKKTLAALAVLGAFAGTSLAADVTLYGVIDTGFGYSHVKTTGSEATDSWGMKSGQNSGSRFALKGEEELGNGLVVGFNLENSFNSDDGTFGQGGRLFGREALLWVRGAFGEISAGRTGTLDAGTGRYNLMGSGATALGTGWADTLGSSSMILLGTDTRRDNTITYKSPSLAGVTVYAQASLQRANSGDDEGSSDANRYYAFGAKYSAGPLNAGLVYSIDDYARTAVTADDDSNGQTISAFVNYDFGMIKPMLATQYYDEGCTGLKGYGIVAGFTAPVAGGTIKVTAGWNDSENAAKGAPDVDYNDMMVGVGYEYKLSKRTTVYTGAGYLEQQTKPQVGGTIKTKTTQFIGGLIHTF